MPILLSQYVLGDSHLLSLSSSLAWSFVGPVVILVVLLWVWAMHGRGVPMDFLVDVSCSRKGEIEVKECVENPCKGSVKI